MEKIYGAIASIMENIGPIGKNRTAKANKFSYSYRGIDDVFNALQPLMIKYKVFCAPDVKDIEAITEASGKDLTMKRSIVKVDYHFMSAEDGSKVTVSIVGEGMDNGDKALNKALSAAFKYACFQLFCIPTEGAMRDSEEEFLTEKELNNIRVALRYAGKSEQNILDYLNKKGSTAQRIEDISYDDYYMLMELFATSRRPEAVKKEQKQEDNRNE